jgi:hypothetical protein
MPSTTHQILLLGAGELGTAFLSHLSALPDTHVTVGVRAVAKYTHLTAPNITLLAIDLSEPSTELSKTLADFNTIISATGFGQSAGTVTKLAKEILAAGTLRRDARKDRLCFFPWQWGVDYDITGDCQGLMPLFGEQLEVRNLLRAKAVESNVKWTIVSTGIFMSFLFEQFWGVVEWEDDRITVRALGNWEHKVTVTDVQDIGKVLARVVVGDVDNENTIVYVAGDTISYARLAEIVEGKSGRAIEREKWSMMHLKHELEGDPEDSIKRYRVVFAGDGVCWDKELTVNHKLGIPMMDVETYTEKLFVETSL